MNNMATVSQGASAIGASAMVSQTGTGGTVTIMQ
jgi:hypothetical protein